MDEFSIVAGGCGRSNSVSISSPHEQAFVLSLLPGYLLKGDVWIGLRREDNGAFKWINEEPLRYVLWATEEPKTSFNCVMMDVRTGYWKTADCSDSRQLLCKVSLRDLNNGIRLESDPLQDDRRRADELYFESACYYFSKEEPVSQEVAQNEKCKSRGAALVSIRNVFENAFVARETSAIQGSLYWTGLFFNDTFAQKAFMWLDASPISFTKWGKYEPECPKGENQGCVLLGSDGREFVWSVSDCSAKAQYICKRFLSESDIVASPQTLPLGYVYSCPNGWTKLGTRSCFKSISERKTWQDSLTDCEILETRSSLARILSIQEQNDLSLLLFKEEDEAWIGLNDVSNEGFYVWSDGSPLVYVNWTLFEDDTNSSLQNVQDCVAATKSFWKFDSCSKEKASVCFTHATQNFDECFNSIDSCHINATCENTIASYICTCKPGFSGNGTICEYYDECSNNADNCHVNAT
ncbi:C-type mannose receptor 2-like [Oscarella lobularis]|uniref:C-type mannose receptor 2-like n=1 Tax=Oscarella lobularis TaxID=121494 RepID=UPI0033139398